MMDVIFSKMLLRVSVAPENRSLLLVMVGIPESAFFMTGRDQHGARGNCTVLNRLDHGG